MPESDTKPLVVDPIPGAGISEILGLLEVLDRKNGRDRVYNLARDLNFDYGNLLLIIKGAEQLELLYTPGTEVILKTLGKKIIEAQDSNIKKRLVLQQLRRLSVFQFIKGVLAEADEKKLSKEKLQDLLHQVLPKERPEQLLQTVLDWGRYGEFLGYSSDDGFVFLDQG